MQRMQRTAGKALCARSYVLVSTSSQPNPDAILKAALPHIADTGFTLASLTAGNPSIPLQAIEALFPTSPTISSRLFSSSPSPPTGPGKALLQYWLTEQRLELQKYLSSSNLTDSNLLREGIHYRLFLNEQHLPALKNAIPLLLRPSMLPLPNPVPFFQHAGNIAGDISHAAYPTAQGEEWYALRGPLAAIYSMTEIYQLEDPSPELTQTRQFADHLLDRREQAKGIVHESSLFGSYFFKSLRGLYNARFS